MVSCHSDSEDDYRFRSIIILVHNDDNINDYFQIKTMIVPDCNSRFLSFDYPSWTVFCYNTEKFHIEYCTVLLIFIR